MQYDVIVVGGGPAGYTAALYAARAGYSALVVNQMTPCGQLATTDKVVNYPGVGEITGAELHVRMQDAAEKNGAKTLRARATFVDLKQKQVMTPQGAFAGRTMILATGACPRELGLDRERELRGRGISYCAYSDGIFFRQKTVAVVGDGNAAVEQAKILSRLCKQVYLIDRRDCLHADSAVRQELLACQNVTILYNTEVKELLGEDAIDGVRLMSRDGESSLLACEGVFIAIGERPNTELFAGQLPIDDSGYVVADESTETSLPGVFVAGDLREKPLRQIATAVSDGATAGLAVRAYLS